MARSISVIVPVYNSELTLPELVRRLDPVLGEGAAEYELVLVNDGSGDESWNIIQKLAAENRWVRGINLMRNYGQHNALLCGIRVARYETVVTKDDDLHHAGGHAEAHCQVGRGIRSSVWQAGKRAPRTLAGGASRLTKSALQRVMGVEVARNVSAFRALRTRLRAAFWRYQSPFVSLDVLLTWGTTRFAAVTVLHHARAAGHCRSRVS
jgi:glycosyltransferase involved in cell wall biosynthesis